MSIQRSIVEEPTAVSETCHRKGKYLFGSTPEEGAHDFILEYPP